MAINREKTLARVRQKEKEKILTSGKSAVDVYERSGTYDDLKSGSVLQSENLAAPSLGTPQGLPAIERNSSVDWDKVYSSNKSLNAIRNTQKQFSQPSRVNVADSLPKPLITNSESKKLYDRVYNYTEESNKRKTEIRNDYSNLDQSTMRDIEIVAAGKESEDYTKGLTGFVGRMGDKSINAEHEKRVDIGNQARNRLIAQGYTRTEIDTWAEMARNKENAEFRQSIETQSEQLAEEHPVLGSAASVFLKTASAPASAVAIIDDVAQGKKIDTNDKLHSVNYSANKIRSTVSEDIAEESKARAWLYNVGMSGADSIVASVIPGGSAILGVNAAVDTTLDLTERGVDSNKALVGGIAAGAFEAIFESISIGRFKALQEVSPKGVKDIVRNLAKSIGVNASEETLTEAANIVYDTIAHGDLSNYNLMVENLKSQGMKEPQAKKEAVKALVGQVFEAGAAGAVMGGAFTAIGTPIGYARNASTAKAIGTQINNAGEADAIIAEGLAAPKGTAPYLAAQQAKKKSEKGKSFDRALGVTAMEVGNYIADNTFETKGRFAKATTIDEVGEIYEAQKRMYEEASMTPTQRKKALKQLEAEHREAVDNLYYSGISGVAEMREAGKSATTSPEAIVKTKMPTIARDDNGNVVSVSEITEVSDGKVTVKTSDGNTSTLDVNAVEGVNAKELWKTASENYTDASSAQAFVDGYNGGPVSEYAKAFNDYYTLASTGMTLRQIENADVVYGNTLTQSAKESAVKAGQTAMSHKSGVVDLTARPKTKAERFQVDMLDNIGKHIGMNIVVIDESMGSFEGFQRAGTNQIVVALDSSKGAIVRTGSHETYHFVKQELGDSVQKISDFVIDTLTENKGESFVKERLEFYKSQGYETEAEQIDELVADSLFDAFSNERAVKQFTSENASLAEKISNHIRKLVADIKNIIKKLVATGKYQEIQAWQEDLESLDRLNNMFLDVLDELAERKGDESSHSQEKKSTAEAVKGSRNRSYDFSKPFAQQVDDYRKGLIPKSDTLVIGGTPEIFKDIGFNALPMTINSTHIDYALYGTKDSDHFLGVKALKQLPQKIENPIAVFVSNTQGTTSVIALLDFTVNGKQTVVPVVVDGFGKNNNVIVDSNAVTSVYGKTTAVDQLYDTINKESNNIFSLLYINKKEAISLLHRTGHQLSGTMIPHDGFYHSIRESNSPVKPKFNDVTETQQFKRWFGDWQKHPNNASKVVNPDGTPKVMYHGTTSSFTAFDKKKAKSSGFYGRGFYFTESEGHAGHYGNAMAVYLDIKNPLEPGKNKLSKEQLRKFLKAVAENEDYDIWNYGTEDISEILESIYRNDAFAVIQDVNATAIGNFSEALELFNEINGTNFDGIMTPTETVVYEPTQIKSATDNIGTFDKENPDIRFSTKRLVEETKDLIAVHNMQESELLKTLQLGGFPMPSIAIIKAQQGHSEYGPVSVVFNKSTIDPKKNKNNKVYGGDAWTPTYPTIEYKINDKVQEKISNLHYELYRKYGADEARPLYNYAYDMERQLNSNRGEAGMIESLKDDERLMQLYLLQSGKGKVEPVIKQTVTELSEADVEMYDYLISAIGKDVISEIKTPPGKKPLQYRVEFYEKNGEKIENAYKRMLRDNFGFGDENIDNVMNNMRKGDFVNLIKQTYQYMVNGKTTTKEETDSKATSEAIRNAIRDSGFNQWVDDLFKGVEEKSGIRNNADYFTSSGNRRSWEALHWENTLENVVKVMKSQNNGVAAFFSGHAIWGVSAKDYKSVDELKADSDRLKKLPQEEYDAIKEGFGMRLNEIATSIMDKSESNQFIAADNAMQCIVEAVRNSKTKSGILNELKQYRQLDVTETAVEDIVSLVSDISNMPTEYFEAKPQRAVGLDEIAYVVVPETSTELVDVLNERGIKTRMYTAGDEVDRVRALNSDKSVLFSTKRDADYMSAVESGDMETAQRMVDEAAESWSNGNRLYTTDDETGEVLFEFYRSADGGRTVWNGHGNNQAQGVFLTSNKYIANAFDPDGKHITVYAKAENPFEIDANGEIYTAIPVDEDNASDWLSDIISYNTVWSDQENDYVIETTVDIDNLYPAAFEQGYDAVIVKNVKEGVGGGIATDVVLKDGGLQMKSADPITYDDNGNVIPLSKRFDENQEDIRYSRKRTVAIGDKEKLIKSIAREPSISEEASDYILDTKEYQDILDIVDQRFEASGHKKLSPKAIDRLAGKLLDKSKSKYSRERLTERLTALFDYIANNRDVSWEDVTSIAAEISKDILKQSQTLDRSMQTEFADVLRLMKESKVFISPELKAEIAYNFGSYEAFRKRLGNKLKVTVTDSSAVPLDVFWRELSEARPDMFDSGVNYLDMPSRLVEFFEMTSPQYVNPYDNVEMDMDEAAFDFALQIYDEYFNIPEVVSEQAKYSREIERLKGKYNAQIKSLHDSYRERIKNLRKEKNNKIEATKELYRQKHEAYRKKRNETQAKQSLRKSIYRVSKALVDKLVKPTDTKYIPQELTRPLLEFSKIITDGGTFNYKKTNRLIEAFAKMERSNTIDGIDSVIDESILNELMALRDLLEDRTLVELSESELRRVRDIVKDFRHLVSTTNEMHAENIRETVSEMGDTFIAEMADKKVDHKRFGTSFQRGLIKPAVFFDLLESPTMQRLYQNIRNGESNWYRTSAGIKTKVASLQKEYGYSEWKNKTVTIKRKMNGQTLAFTMEEALSIYATSQRDQGLQHLLADGFVRQKDEYKRIEKALKKESKKKGKKSSGETPKKIIEAMQGRAVRLAVEDISAIVDAVKKASDGKAIKYADGFVGYMSKDMAELGNETTLKLKGRKIFGEDYYFPIVSDPNHLHFSAAKGIDARLKNMSMTKATVEKAKNAIVIGGFTDTAAKHCLDMAMYTSFTLPLEDFTRVFNYDVGATETSDATGVRQEIERVYGSGANEYIKNLLSDINGGVVVRGSGIVNKLMSMAKRDAVIGSMSVAIQQPSAIARALVYVNPKYFVKTTFSKKDWEQLKEYAPVAGIKEMGYFDMNIGQSALEWVTDKSTVDTFNFGDKLKNARDWTVDKLAWLPSYMDKITWGHIWNAVKKQTAESHPEMDINSEEFLKLAGERFTYVIDRTQVYDSVFARSEYMRSKDSGLKQMLAFMNEPLTSLNMFYETVVMKQDKKKWFVTKTVFSLLSAMVLNSALKSIIQTMRDDDDETSAWEQYLANLVENVLYEPFGWVPIFGDVLDYLRTGFESQSMTDSTLRSFADSLMIWFDDNKSTYEKVKATLSSVGLVTGLPIKNLWREFEAAKNGIKSFIIGVDNTWGAGWGEFLSEQEWLFGESGVLFSEDDRKIFAEGGANTTAKGVLFALHNALEFEKIKFTKDINVADQAVIAYFEGDQTHVDRMLAQLLRKKGDQDEVESAIRSAVKNRYLEGNITKDEVEDILVNLVGDDKKDIVWKIEEWDGGDDWTKYGDFYEAIDSGKNLKSVIKEYNDKGVESSTLAGRITDQYKEQYIELYKTDRQAASKLKTKLVEAYATLGKKRSEKSKDIDAWLKPKKDK